MTLQQLRYFCAIARHSSYREASEELFVSQPTISAAILALEKELGFLLFDRKGRQTVLTKYGEQYYQELAPLLEQLNRATDRVRQMASAAKGHLDLAYNPPLSKGFIPNIVRLFLDREENQNVTVHFHQNSSKEIVEGIQTGTFDLGFCSFVPGAPHVNFQPVLRQEMVAVVPLDHPLAESGAVSLKELSSFPFVAYASHSGLRRVVDGFFQEAGVSLEIFAEAEDEDAIAALTASGFGVGVVAKMQALQYFPVRQIPIKEKECQRMLYLASSTHRYLTPAARRFFDFVQERVDTGQLPEV
ncbi:LysR substrate-binding domain-containing protein [Hominifimenecus sp. rT4P-3]|uniref:LysR substrate-binding domain-containing protein n=1 Tax=Hominifimenecus sp. rT4P-3 TaxID=3242979 RepID=UPI003DA5D86F